MLEPTHNIELPPIPAKRYFTIGEVGELCGVKPHVLRYWEQEFSQLKPVKRRGNRRYYQRHDVMMIRQIRSLLYEQGFTIGGARQKLEGDGEAEDTKKNHSVIQQMRIELEEIADVTKQIITPAESIPIIGIIQDGLLGSYNLTDPALKIDWKEDWFIWILLLELHLYLDC